MKKRHVAKEYLFGWTLVIAFLCGSCVASGKSDIFTTQVAKFNAARSRRRQARSIEFASQPDIVTQDNTAQVQTEIDSATAAWQRPASCPDGFAEHEIFECTSVYSKESICKPRDQILGNGVVDCEGAVDELCDFQEDPDDYCTVKLRHYTAANLPHAPKEGPYDDWGRTGGGASLYVCDKPANETSRCVQAGEQERYCKECGCSTGVKELPVGSSSWTWIAFPVLFETKKSAQECNKICGVCAKIIAMSNYNHNKEPIFKVECGPDGATCNPTAVTRAAALPNLRDSSAAGRSSLTGLVLFALLAL